MTGPRAGLALGNQAKSERAAVRTRIAAGDVDVRQLLHGDGDEDTERTALQMPVAQLIAAVPGIGPDAADRILTGRCGPTRRLGELTTRARRGIADSLDKELTT